MNSKKERQRRIDNSKKLSWALRHGINQLGIEISPAGFVSLKALLATAEFRNVTIEEVEEIVASDNKGRFTISKEADDVLIRANQGHSIQEVKDEELLTPITNPYLYPIVLHGTNNASWKSIKNRGLYRMARNHIHFAIGLPGAGEVISGARVSCEVFIFIDMVKAIIEGIKFFISQNSVVLSPGLNGFISPRFFSKVLIHRIETPIEFFTVEFDYFLVLDFEANCVERGSMPCQEIIEFPVKALNAHTLEVDHTFHYYVKPEVVPSLSEFCTKLTGITQEMVSGQDVIGNILDKFHEFLLSTDLISKRWVFVTCGDWDLNTCLPKEAGFKKLSLKEYFSSWINIKTLVPMFKGGMMAMLKQFEIEHSGRHHSGIDDVTNICECLKHLLGSGLEITLEDVRRGKVSGKI